MTALDVDHADPHLMKREAPENDDLLVAGVIDRFKDAKFQEFATFVKAFGVHTDLAERIYQNLWPDCHAGGPDGPLWPGKWQALVSRRPTELAADQVMH
jgi:hypothetical protein